MLNNDYLQSKNLRYFFTTHSNHFLDSSIVNDDVSIFQFEELNKNKFFVKANVKPERKVLDVLGVNNTSVFLANTSIWVEGPTDRKYLSKLLKLYSEFKNEQNLKEDIDFAFFEYGGNLIEHYLFDKQPEVNDEVVRSKINSLALSNKIFLLADNDNTKGNSAKGRRRKALYTLSHERENFTFFDTAFVEIENLLPKRIIKDFMKELVKTGVHEKVMEIDFKRSDYTKIRLGNFYDKLLDDYSIPKNKRKSFKASSGTLMNDYKIKLSNFVITSDNGYADFIVENKELKQIVEALYAFIKE